MVVCVRVLVLCLCSNRTVTLLIFHFGVWRQPRRCRFCSLRATHRPRAWRAAAAPVRRRDLFRFEIGSNVKRSVRGAHTLVDVVLVWLPAPRRRWC